MGFILGSGNLRLQVGSVKNNTIDLSFHDVKDIEFGELGDDSLSFDIKLKCKGIYGKDEDYVITIFGKRNDMKEMLKKFK